MNLCPPSSWSESLEMIGIIWHTLTKCFKALLPHLRETYAQTIITRYWEKVLNSFNNSCEVPLVRSIMELIKSKEY